MADTKNKNTGISVWEKINKQAEYIAKNEKNTLLDIDVMLDYLRQMYDEYMTMRINIDNAEKAAAPKNECRMRSLFDDADFNEIAESPAPKPEPVAAATVAAAVAEEATVPTEEPKAAPVIEQELPAPAEEIQEEEPVCEAIVEEPVEEEPVAVLTEEEPEAAAEPAPVPEAPVEEPEDIPEEEPEDIPEEEPEEEPIEEVAALDADDIFDFVPAEEDMATEEGNSDAFDDIDLDEIEFEEEEDDAAPAAAPVTPAPSRTHANMPPAYWGDEIDTDTPAPSKPMSIGETYRQERPSINDMLANYQKNNTIGQKLPSSGSIMGNMDMNDKFTFIKELFQNDNTKFQESINRLDSIKSLKDVIICLESMKKLYHWNDNNASVLRLQELIYAKFRQN